MSDQALIALDQKNLVVTFTQAAEAIKTDALSASALVARVASAEENSVANEALQKLSSLRRVVEKGRQEAKAPIIRFGKNIDAQAEAFVAEVAKEEGRVSKLIGDFFQLEEAKRKAAEQAARLEAERIERLRREEEMRILRVQAEREAAARREQEALAAKQRQEEAEAQRKIREASNAKAREAAEREAKIRREAAEREAIELKRQQDLATAATHEALDAANERASNAQAAIASVPIVAPVRAEGQRVRADWEITITDVWLLARAHGTCVKIEPLIGEIKSLLNAGVKVAGVSAKEVFKAGTRSTNQKAIDV